MALARPRGVAPSMCLTSVGVFDVVCDTLDIGSSSHYVAPAPPGLPALLEAVKSFKFHVALTDKGCHQA